MFACIHVPDPGAGVPTRLRDRLRECAASFAPEAEATAPNTILFDASRLNRLYGGPEQIAEAVLRHAQSLGLAANVAIAPNTATAVIVARNFRGVTVIPEDTAAALAGLDVRHLPLSEEVSETLEAWGIRTFEDLARLPETGIAERLGQEGVYLQQLARGAGGRPLRVLAPEIVFEERVELEHPLSELEPLLFIVSRILNDQCEKLQSHGMATNEIRIVLDLGNRTQHVREIRLPLPMRQSKAMLKLLQLELEAHPPAAPVASIHLVLKPVQPRTIQNGLFLPVTPAPDKLEITLTRIRALVGEKNVGVPELLNTHRPAPFRLRTGPYEPRKAEALPHRSILAFRYFQPPLSAKVEMIEQRPIRLAAGAIRGNVITYAGPWRSSGDWWTEGPWNRDEWDVSLNDGAIYRIYREPEALWFVEGSYD